MAAAGALKQAFERSGGMHADAGRIRLHRALSWFARAEAAGDDLDARFLFLWIAFNAAYAREFGEEDSTRSQVEAFFGRLLELDRGRRIAQLLFERYAGSIRILMDNKFVFLPFWRAMRDHDSSERWREAFVKSRQAALRALMKGDTGRVLSLVFDRLYVLRNQLVHGGATWNSRLNRAQVRDGANILMDVVPVMLELMIDNPQADFGEIVYPVLPD